MNNAALIFDKGHPFIADVLDELLHRSVKFNIHIGKFLVANFHYVFRFNGRAYADPGPLLITRVMKEKWCSDKEVFSHGSVCRGVTLLAPSTLYPLSWEEYQVFFNESPESLSRVLALVRNNDAYMIHWSNLMSAGLRVNWSSTIQPFAFLARILCPVVSENARTKVTSEHAPL